MKIIIMTITLFRPMNWNIVNAVDAAVPVVAVNNSNFLFFDDEIQHPCIHCVIEREENTGKDGV